MNVKRCVIIETRTRWTVDIPDDIPDENKIQYAWKRLLLFGDRIPKAGKRDMQVQFFPPWDVVDKLIREKEVPAPACDEKTQVPIRDEEMQSQTDE